MVKNGLGIFSRGEVRGLAERSRSEKNDFYRRENDFWRREALRRFGKNKPVRALNANRCKIMDIFAGRGFFPAGVSGS